MKPRFGRRLRNAELLSRLSQAPFFQLARPINESKGGRELVHGIMDTSLHDLQVKFWGMIGHQTLFLGIVQGLGEGMMMAHSSTNSTADGRKPTPKSVF